MLFRNLTANPVSNLLPAVTNTENDSRVSSRYKHVQTSDVVDALSVHGFQVTGQRQKSDTGKHGVILVNREFGFIDRTGSENFATITLFNSHDARGAVQLIAGFYRLICSNGMVSGELTDTLRVRHSQNGIDQLSAIVAMAPARLRVYAETILAMQNKELTDKERVTLAQNIFTRIQETRAIGNVPDLLFPRRPEDVTNDLYTTANIIQENIIKGGMQSANSNRRLRPVTGLQSQTELTQLVMNEATALLRAA